MKSAPLLLLAFLFAPHLSSSVRADDFSLEAFGPMRVIPLNTTAEIFVKITNLTDAELPFSIAKVEELPSGWSASICLETCLAPFIDSTDSKVPPGGSDSISVWINAFTNEGSGKVMFTIRSKGAGGTVERIEFGAITEGVDLLVVDADGGESYEDYIVPLLPDGAGAGMWDAWSSAPADSDLAHFTDVFWLTGSRSDLFDESARQAVRSYLDGGGHLFLSGQNIVSALCDEVSPRYSEDACAFVADALHASYGADTAGTTVLAGVAGDGLGNGLDFAITGGTGAANQSSPDGVTPSNGGRAFLDYPGTAYAGGIRYASGDTRFVFLPFGFEGIADDASREAIVDRTISFFEDDSPPELTVGLLQNPYLTDRVDIYVVGSEALDAASLSLTADGSALAVELSDGDENVFRAPYTLMNAGEISLQLSAEDMAGHQASATRGFTAARISAANGGTVTSADGAARLTFAPGAPSRDGFIIVVPGVFAPGAKEGAVPAGLILSAGDSREKRIDEYTFSPAGMLGAATATLSLKWDEGRFDDDALGRLTVFAGDGPVESWVDAERRTVTASVHDLGAFRLAPGTGDHTFPADRMFAALRHNEPNPFNPTTTIRFEIRAEQKVRVEIYDVAGRLVKRLVSGVLPPGVHETIWRGDTVAGADAPSGVYFARLAAGKTQQTRKLTLIR